MPSRSKSSQRWLKEHFSDPYVKKAQAEGMRSRAAYKLEELVERDKLLKPGMVVVDLGDLIEYLSVSILITCRH